MYREYPTLRYSGTSTRKRKRVRVEPVRSSEIFCPNGQSNENEDAIDQT